MSFSQEQIDGIISLKKSFQTSSFNDIYSQVEKETEELPVIYREQYRLYCLFCLYQIQGSFSRQGVLPSQILNFHKRLLNNCSSLSFNQIKKIWTDFGNPNFLHILEIVANGNTSLQKIIKFIQLPPGGKAWLDFLNQNSDKSIKDLTPEYLSFIPTKLPSNFNLNLLISQEEYDQMKLKP